MSESHIAASVRTRAAEPERSAAIRLSDVSVHYGEHCAVCDVTVEFAARRITALIGASGCGKSSLLMRINRLTDLVPGCRVGGTVHIGDEAVDDPRRDLTALRRRVGMIFQRPTPFPISIVRNLDLPLREHGLGDADRRRRRIENTLKQVGLWDEVKDRLDQPATQLSGGQQQRLCLARSLLLEPDVLLFDEPCSALDPKSTAQIEQLIRELGEQYTVVVVTHNLAQARRIAGDVAFLDHDPAGGRLVEFGPAEQVFSAAAHEATRQFLAHHG